MLDRDKDTKEQVAEARAFLLEHRPGLMLGFNNPQPFGPGYGLIFRHEEGAPGLVVDAGLRPNVAGLPTLYLAANMAEAWQILETAARLVELANRLPYEEWRAAFHPEMVVIG